MEPLAAGRRARAILLTACLAVAGCSEELGPERIPRTVAEGVVRFSGRPLDRGWVELQPLDGTLGDICSTRIRPDGSFRFDRAPVGKVAVRLVDVPIELPQAVWILRNGSPIRRETVLPPGPPMIIDVYEELVRYQAARGASR